MTDPVQTTQQTSAVVDSAGGPCVGGLLTWWCAAVAQFGVLL